jgi:hypothetical protein
MPGTQVINKILKSGQVRRFTNRLRGRSTTAETPSTANVAATPPRVLSLIELDLEFYSKHNPDLPGRSDDDLKYHYFNHGYWEGRQSNSWCLRETLIKSLKVGKTLEIGPFCSPILQGPSVKYLDMLGTEELKARARSLQLDAQNVPHIDFVSPDGTLCAVDEKFELVVSCHNLEHQTDLVGHLNEVSALLEPSGTYALIIPDWRFCFDANLSKSTIADVLEAHEQKRKTHTLASVIEHRALTTHNEPNAHWTELKRRRQSYHPLDVRRVRAALTEYAQANGAHIDVHAWQFEPFSFADIVRCLIELDLIEFRDIRCSGPVQGRAEFTAQLIK